MTNKDNQNNKKKNSNNKTTKSGLVQNANLLHYTKQQISSSVNKYDKAIAKKTLTFNPLSFEDEANLNHENFYKRLNSMDSTMLEETAYHIIDDSEFKLEQRLEKIEQHIKEVDEKIIVAEAIKDVITLDELNLQRAILEKKYKQVRDEYKTKSVDTRLTTFLTSIIMIPYNLKKKLKKQIRYFLFHSQIVKNCKPLARIIMVRETILKLNKINKSVDELVKMKVPFGEQDKKYEKLINHLSQAGALHSQIMKELRN